MPRHEPVGVLDQPPQQALLRDTDVYSVAHGLEDRLLLDHRLVEFVAPLPGRLKIGVVIGDVPSFRVDNMPYGGVKDSGLGREGIRYAIEDMTEIRLMVMRDP